ARHTNKLRGWFSLAAGSSTQNCKSLFFKAPRLQNGTSWFYFATEQYRSDCIDLADRVSKLAKPRYRLPGDYNVLAARLG
ncbi:Nitrate reductase, alpha subunit, partial [human gut metagenome]